MGVTRRGLFARARDIVLAAICALFPLAGRSQARTGALKTRKASTRDASALAEIFNGHLAAGFCPFIDTIEPWNSQLAATFLSLYSATLIIERDGVPVGFGAAIDYSKPATLSSIEPDVPPDIPVVALNFDAMQAEDVLPTLKFLVFRGCEELQRMGFQSCRMRIPARRVLPTEAWFRNFMVVDRAIKRDGVDEALEVVFDLSRIRESLAREGF